MDWKIFYLIFFFIQILRHRNLKALIYFYMKVCGFMKSSFFFFLILTSFVTCGFVTLRSYVMRAGCDCCGP